ncbi:hypothetical protein TVAG_150030 [Trichomonas vaginalis G3]|uniref:Uncharacterized protein n=1 Tax=Trichomonas vaginalis (strain ATCC PRA-98 / G3) TaxID=412133 RepID=A2DRQ5_TRIV3|nr:hypothetical protein TVAGG3_0979190 [Trichomonas vaginalis G3]EAY16852.1 hypothetical protein TVAG_150030 [Trichomonas vaginalis G3]KAI5489159.1 hypothetical protein TVAGG3_0979190 [Trichomonas vaginalis G3]|eukprot:XP_001329075.1 hypothetical protein [Trichomonas vaginalis G3]
MIITSHKHRNYSPPKTNLAKILKQNKIDVPKKLPSQSNFQLPSIKNKAPKPIQEEFHFEAPKYAVNHPNVTFADLNFLTVEKSPQNLPISRVETPKLGFSIKHPSPKLIRNQSTIAKQPKQPPHSMDTPKLSFDEFAGLPTNELKESSEMIYPDGHMSPLVKTRSANLIIV